MLKRLRSPAVLAVALVLAACSSAPSRRAASAPPARAEVTPRATPAPAPSVEKPSSQAIAQAAAAAAAGLPPADKGPTPSEIERLPEPEPRVEPIRPAGPNKPYVVGRETMVPDTRDEAKRERGMASWYGRKFHGRRTANGEVFNMYGFSAAHRTWPIPSYAKVRHVASGREIVVRINDRGPFARGRMLDLSYAAAVKLGFVAQGHAEVEVERLTHEQIRTGSWRIGAPAVAEAAAAPPAVPPAGTATTTDATAAAPAEPLVAVSTAAVEAAGSGPAGAETTTAAAGKVRDASAAPRGFWLQLGAFRDLAGAGNFQQHVQAELEGFAPMLAIFLERPLYRLQAGPFASREEAASAGQRLREALQLVPMIVQRR